MPFQGLHAFLILGLGVLFPPRKPGPSLCLQTASLPTRLTVWSVEKRLSKDVHALTFGTCEYVVLQGQRDYADVIKNLEMGRDCPGLSR